MTAVPAPPNDSIVLTGCGWVTPFAGGTIDEVLAAARDLPVSSPPPDGYWAVPGELCVDTKATSSEIKRDQGAWITATALEHALRSASLNLKEADSGRVGLVVGNAFAGQLGMIRFAEEVRDQSPRFVSPIHFPQTVGNYVAGAIARAYGITGPNSTVATGAASGLDAIVEARGILNAGAADTVIAGGMETLSRELAVGLAEPGVRLSEGACLFVIERAETAKRRGAATLVTIGATTCHGRAASPESDGNAVLFSTVLQHHPGAVCIEHWVGRCFGCLGAAAVAGVIAAGSGALVPLSDPDGGDAITIRAPSEARLQAPEGPLHAIVTADADGTGARRVSIELELASGRYPDRCG